MSAGARWLLPAMALAIAPVLHDPLQAQSRSLGCGYGNRLLRSSVGATLGGWAGLVAMKIRLSDWNDASRTPAGTGQLNRGIAVGAVLGLALGNLHFGAACRPAEVDGRAPTSPIQRFISLDEIQRAAVNGSVYDLVYALRRSWLNTRGISLAETPRLLLLDRGAIVTPAEKPMIIVYLDNVKLGDQDQLKTMPVDGVVEVRYLDAAEATFKWGAGHDHGAIQVLTVARTDH